MMENLAIDFEFFGAVDGSQLGKLDRDTYANPVFETLAGERHAFERIVVESGGQGPREIEKEAVMAIASLTKRSRKSP